MPKLIDQAQVFEAVIDLFVSRGYEGATTKEIARLAGVNEATLFRKFNSKAELFEQAINHEWSDVPLSKLAHTGDLEADLLAIVNAYLETNRLHGAIVPMLLAELSRSRDLEGAFDVAWGNIRIVAEIITLYQSEGALQAEDPLATLNALIGPLMTAHMFRRARLDHPVPEIDIDLHVRGFLHGRTPTIAR